MEKLPVDEIVKRIAELGFNCVRVAYSLEAHVRNPFLEEQFVKANRFLSGKRFLDGFDAGIEALTKAGLMVVMALCFGMELRPMRSHPIKLDLPNRVVYETHNYVEYQFWNLIPRDLGITFSTLRTITMLSCGKLRLELRRLSFERHDLLPSETLEEACCVGGVGGAWSALFSLIFMAMAFTTYKAQAVKAACTYCKWGAQEDFLPLLGNAMQHTKWSKSVARDLPLPQDLVPQDLLPRGCIFGSSQLWVDLLYLWTGTCCKVMKAAMRNGFVLGTLLVKSRGRQETDLFRKSSGEGSGREITRWLDKQWGFALEEGQAFTAPIWMGEFGYLSLSLRSYLSSRDVDFAYWAINGIKYSEGFNQANGTWNRIAGWALGWAYLTDDVRRSRVYSFGVT
ncbi:unnamed protein product [Durusdinium trenchii]|uniref:Cellulase n=1 Tax=Durusdinium trenchii TaxID=1381693 RepID=A0ABP0P489_9DINO